MAKKLQVCENNKKTQNEYEIEKRCECQIKNQKSESYVIIICKNSILPPKRNVESKSPCLIIKATY